MRSKMEVAKITISNRTEKKVEDLKKIYPDLEIQTEQNIDFDMIINATSLGLGKFGEVWIRF